MKSRLTKNPCIWTCFLVLPVLSISCENFDSTGDAGTPAGLAEIGGATSGLLATYFDNKDFTDQALERVDSVVDFDWGKGSPDSKVGSDSFSVRWTGFIEAKYSETYRFYIVGDDGIRLYVDDELVVSDWSNHGSRERSGTISLDAGKLYSIKLEYYEDGGGAVAKLLWSSSSQSKQIIPTQQLFTELPADGIIITASGENAKYGEVKENAFDGDTKTKWLTFQDSAWIQYDFDGDSSEVVTKYSITSANDAPERDPRDWRLLGSNDGEHFTKVDERSGETFTARLQKRTFAVQSPGAFTMYRLDISSNYDPPRANSTQLAEIELQEGDVADECPDDPKKTEPGLCGCGIPEGTCGAGGEVTNVALGKPTVQSTTAYRGESSRAVDGNTSGRYGDESVTHTSNEFSPWWQVDLGGAHRVQRVVLFNRTDCCGNRLSDFHVDYLDDNGNVVATQKHDGAAGAETEIALAASGVYSVRVQLGGTNFLSLAEVQVFGVAGTSGGGTGIQDQCPGDPSKTVPGECGCGVPEGTCDGGDDGGGTGGGSFSLAVLPDLQKVTRSGENAAKLYDVADFIADKQRQYNVKAVLDVGDIVQVAVIDEHQSRWDRMLKGAHILEDAGIPFIPACGNHDGCDAHYGSVSDYNAQFAGVPGLGSSRREEADQTPYLVYDNPYFMDNFSLSAGDDGVENAAYEIEYNGRKFIVLSLRYNTNRSQLDAMWDRWAHGVLDRNSDKDAIILTHEFHASHVENMCRHDNVFLAIQGHRHGSRTRSVIDCGGGHKIEKYIFAFRHGGDNDMYDLDAAAARFYTFDLDANRVCFKTFSVRYNKWLTETKSCDPNVDSGHCDEFCFDHDFMPPA